MRSSRRRASRTGSNARRIGRRPTASACQVTPPDKTKLCWDGYNACVAAGNAKPDAARTMASLPPMKRFELRKSGEISTFSECHIDGTEVRCKGGQTPRPGLHSYESIVTGRISGSVITGDFLVRIVSGDQDCITHTEISGPLTVTLRPNGEAAVQHASLQMRQPKNSGARCSPLRTEMIPASQETQSWRVLE